jgi:hypothetical protein
MTNSRLVYTCDAASSARREARREARWAAANARMVRAEQELERKLARELPSVTALVREEGEWFNVKVYDTMGKWRGQGFSAESVARMLLDPETDVEYWPTPE